MSGHQLVPVALAIAPAHRIVSLAANHRGGMWVFDRELGLFLIRDGRATVVPLPADIPKQRVAFMYRDTGERTWLALDTGTVGVLEETRAFHVPSRENGVSQREVSAIAEDSRGNVWIGGLGGLTRIAGTQVATITDANGLPYGRVLAIAEDAQGDLWITVELVGIIRVTRAELQAAFHDSAIAFSSACTTRPTAQPDYPTRVGLARYAQAMIDSGSFQAEVSPS